MSKCMADRQPTVRPQPVQLSLFGDCNTGSFPLCDVLRAARLCLRGKEQTWEAQEFVYNWWSECVRVWRELNDCRYIVSRYIVFIKHWPVIREIFGSAFRDRVVDTLFMMRVLPVMEQQFVVDNYSTRKDKGALFGVMRVAEMIRTVSEGYTRDCFVMKIDIMSFFVSISREIAYRLWERFLTDNYYGPDRWLLLATVKKILYDSPERHCVVKGHLSDWAPLPRSKSLLMGGDGRHGLPIGKVISQMTALLYLDDIDHRLVSDWGLETNGHYMDDRVIVDTDEEQMWEVKRWLDTEHEKLELRTHPRKVSLQHCSKGVLFAGAMIMPGRIYVSNRTVGSCFHKLYAFNRCAAADAHYAWEHAAEFANVMNSYLGLMGHYSEWNTVHRLIRTIGPEWYGVMWVVGRRGRYKVQLHPGLRPRAQAKRHLHRRMKMYFK